MCYTLEGKWSEKINLWSEAIIKVKHFSEPPDKKLGVQNDGLGPTKLFTRPKIRKSFFSVVDFCKTFWEIFDFFQKPKTDHFLPQFAARHVWILEKSHIPWRRARKNEKNVHLRFLIFETSSHTFFNDRKSIFQNVKMCEMMKKSEISQNVLQKSMTEKNDFLIFGRVKSFVGSSPSFSTPNFLSGTPEKCFNFMIALDHNCIFSDHQKNLKINLWSEAIIKLKPFPEAPDKKFGVQNDGLEPTKLFMWPKMRKLFILVMDFCKTFWEIFYFFQKSKTAHFLGQFTTSHVWILEKSHIPWRRARKNEQNVHLRFLIFETSSHTFLNDRKGIFQNVKMCEIMKH